MAFEGTWAEISIVTAVCTAQDLHRLAGDEGEKIRGSATTATPVLVSVAGHCRGGFEVLATPGWVARGRMRYVRSGLGPTLRVHWGHSRALGPDSTIAGRG